ncbi:MAG: EamA family transporter [Anaerolineae bacterium]|nr:EamA family transporter [Anaerolineae bacterium]
MSDSPLLGIGFGLAAASSWGAGDYCGGLASRRTNVYGVVVVSQFAGLVLLSTLALLLSEPFPTLTEMAWAAIAGVGGAVGLSALYRGLATGPMGVVAPVAAVVSVILPLIFGLFLEGMPGLPQLLGFGLALCAVWFITRAGDGSSIQARGLVLPVVAGLGFGVFFILIDHVSAAAVLWPLAAARVASVSALLVLILLTRQPARPAAVQMPLILMSGLFDTGGNAFYALAARTGRLDIAAVLSSLYPAVTVILAWLILKERLSRLQGVGLALAMIAVLLIAA